MPVSVHVRLWLLVQPAPIGRSTCAAMHAGDAHHGGVPAHRVLGHRVRGLSAAADAHAVSRKCMHPVGSRRHVLHALRHRAGPGVTPPTPSGTHPHIVPLTSAAPILIVELS